jgi:hypothetical protein
MSAVRVVRRVCVPALILALSTLLARPAQANGRMPGANDVIFDARDPNHLVVRATFGVVQTFDAGARWSWICEQAVDVSGVIADPPLGMLEDQSLVLLPPTGSALISRDQGCSWKREASVLAGKQGVDLTMHPSDPKQLFVVTSTVTAVDAGFGVYENLVVRTGDDAKSWELLSTLPTDFQAETMELAKSNPQRLYVSGVDSVNPRLGVLFVSDDGGASFQKRTLDLPTGSGSFLISGIHPTNPDMVWLRVPARGDTIGILPARLFLTTDAGKSFRMLAATQRAMFGFALSPDGTQLAYGGPNDGLYVGPSDGSGGFQKRGNWSIRCLRWTDSGALYACGGEPFDAFSLGVSTDQGMTFRPLYKLADTCPAECAAGSQFAGSCQEAWGPVRPMLKAAANMCTVPWADDELDAGAPMSLLDGGPPALDASVDAADEAAEPALDAAEEPADDAASADKADADADAATNSGERDGGCSCGVSRSGRGVRIDLGGWLALASVGLRARRKRHGRAA